MGGVRLGDPLILAAEERTYFWPIPAASAAEKISAPPMQRLGFCEYSTQLVAHRRHTVPHVQMKTWIIAPASPQ
ncbi:hypothetical protein SEA_GATOR_44 [Mycobacterium phage Gator]|nr:hypothetical protein SEA_GATOR_44 [Mycobacterium phage Gator]